MSEFNKFELIKAYIGAFNCKITQRNQKLNCKKGKPDLDSEKLKGRFF